MLPKKYHALISANCMLVMLLLIGLYLLGIGYSSSQAVAGSADLASSSSASASSAAKLTSQNGPVYRHPINYYKLTGATNQMNEVPDARQPIASSDYPIDHYQQDQQEKQHFVEPDLYWPMDIRQPSAFDSFPEGAQMNHQAARITPPQFVNNHLDEPADPYQQQVNQQPPQLQQQHQLVMSTTSSPIRTQIPTCATRQMPDNSTAGQTTMPEVVFLCNDDPEYPTKEIMRALEAYATDRSIEQLLPQLIQINQRSPAIDGLDPLQSIGGGRFPSNEYESMCRSSSYLAQPRRARNLLGQWKIVVNLPGRMYRGTAVSQMIRVEECLRPSSECNTPSVPTSALGRSILGGETASVSLLPKSRCLQHYESQRLVTWSQQQGLHLDIFRIPIACSCHIRR